MKIGADQVDRVSESGSLPPARPARGWADRCELAPEILCRSGGSGSSPDAIAALEPLKLDHIAVMAAGGHQLVMSADLADDTVAQDDDAVSMADGAQPVGNHERGPVAKQPRKALLDQTFA